MLVRAVPQLTDSPCIKSPLPFRWCASSELAGPSKPVRRSASTLRRVVGIEVTSIRIYQDTDA